MKRKTAIILFLSILLPTIAAAATVSESEARQKAADFLSKHSGINRPDQSLKPLSVTNRRNGKAAPAATPYYLYNVGEAEGFIVVSGDDRTDAILGYADKGSLCRDELPDALQYLLDGYAEQIAWLDAHPTVQRATVRKMVRNTISPLMQTRWNQGAPYNSNCPVVDEENTVTGCVATSMAQVMYYHQHPQTATEAIPAYTTKTRELAVAALDATTFSWDDMTVTYGSSSSVAAKAAVAELMQYCGASIQMDYGLSSEGGSSAYNASIPGALKLYFGYSNDVNYISRRSYDYIEWLTLIYDELASGRPVILGGQSVGGGHSFVCDGYEADDFFHINWGWGGMSDGYFRLSLLSPVEQGFGGSSSLDGFSYGQDAIIGIHPAANNETGAVCLSLEAMQFGSANASASKSFTRMSSGEAFTGIPLFLALCSYRFGTHDFDYAVQLVSEDGIVCETIVSETAVSFSFNTDRNVSSSEFQMGQNLADGLYYVRVVSRLNGTSEWQNCYGGTHFVMTAEIEDNQLTLTPARIIRGNKPSLVSITADDTPTLGTETDIIARLCGGKADYHGNLFLYAGGKRMMGRQADIPAGEEVDVHFSYIPSAAGTNTLAIYADGTSLGTQDIAVASNDATMALTLGLAVDISNVSGGKLYGNGIRATITATNDSEDYNYVGVLNCSVRKYDGDSFVGKATSYPIFVPMNGSIDVPIVVDGLELGATYRLRITYYTTESGVKKLAGNEILTDAYVMDEGFLVCDVDGNVTLHEKSDASNIDAARFVDFSAISDWTDVSVTANANPNCLYLLTAGTETPAELTGLNVIKGTHAAAITLFDGYPFFAPFSFTADAISYSRTFTLAAAGTSGWNTIMLPFTPTSVTCDGAAVDWFHNASDTGKNFWLKTFTGDDTGVVYFDFAATMTANTPYIIAVPDDRFGSEWQMTGKEVVFSAADVTVAATTHGALSGNNYDFCGATVATPLTDAYVLNSEGSRFVKTASATTAPFRAWISTANISSLTMPALRIASGVPSSIGSADCQSAFGEHAVHDLKGHRVDKSKGLFIQDGKKYIRQ